MSENMWSISICHHHNVMLLASIPLTISGYHSQLSIAPGRSFQATSCIGMELLYIGSSCLSNNCSSMLGDPTIVNNEFVLTSPAVSCMSSSSNFGGFRNDDRWPYSYCLVGCCFRDLFNTAYSILM